MTHRRRTATPQRKRFLAPIWVGLALLLIFTLSLVSCLPPPSPEPTATQVPPEAINQPVSSPETIPATIPVTLAPPSPTYAAAPTTTPHSANASQPSAGDTRYTLSAILDHEQHLLAVEEQIAYTNRSGESQTDLLLVVEPSRYPDVFHLKTLTWADGQPVNDYTRAIGLLRLPLPKPLAPGEPISVSLSYELRLPSPDPAFYGRPVPFGYSARQTNLVDWYPFLPPYLPGQGWQYHQPGPFGEHLVYEAADFEVNLRFAGSERALIVAASAPSEPDGEGLRFRLENARTFAWSVSAQYEVKTAQVGGVTVLSYNFPVHSDAGQVALNATTEALALYTELFGPYPRTTLSLVEADFLDGMEYDGLYFLSKGFYNLYSGTPADYLTAIAAHETAHQWWYGLVGNDQALEPWLDEALCTYSERLFYERLHPDALPWWWTYRVRYYQPGGWVDGTIYNPAGYRAYRDAVYLNGALFLEDLRSRVGEEIFFNFLRDYAHQNVHKITTADRFFSILTQHTPLEIASLTQQYFADR